MDVVDNQAAGRLLFGRGYYLEFDQFSRLLDIASAPSARPEINEVTAALGIAHAKVRGLVSLARGLGLITRSKIQATPLGNLVHQYDPFFDDIGTLWYLHYVVASQPRHLVWNRLVNETLARERQFTMHAFRDSFGDQIGKYTEHSLRLHVQYETRTVLDAYVHRNFNRLDYIEEDDNLYRVGKRQIVPFEVMGASIVLYQVLHRPGTTAVAVTDLIGSRNSPGIVFQLQEERLRAALEQLKMVRGFSLESRADLDQVRFTEGIPAHAWMERYYAGR